MTWILGPMESKTSFIILEGTASLGEVEGFMTLTMSLSSSSDTGRKWSKRAEGLTPKWCREVTGDEGVKDCLMWFILSIKHFINVVQMSVDGSTCEGACGLMIEFKVLKRILGRWTCLLIILEKCITLAALAAVWNVAREFLKIWKETVRWSFFHFRSAVRQTRLRERVVSSSHGCDMSLGRLSLKGAMESKIAEHEEL